MALHVVTGPPAAGKTTYVSQRAQHGDIVIDLDAIAAALTPDADGHRHPVPVLRTAQRARAAAITEALRHCTHVDVWIIQTNPRPEAIARYAEHNARIITIDPGRDVVMQRVDHDRPQAARAVAARWYATDRSHITEREHVQSVQSSSRSW